MKKYLPTGSTLTRENPVFVVSMENNIYSPDGKDRI
jgi:hypothetical protein